MHRLTISIFVIAAAALPLAAQISVTSASPNSAAQGTINLNIAVGGSGFKHGAASQFFISGTTNPGGITVNSTAFISSSQLTANISVSTTASISSFDIQVTNSDGRTGKGTGLFSVTNPNSVSNQGCILQPLPSAFTLVNTLNYVNSSGVNQYPGTLGLSTRARLLTLGGKPVLVTAVGSGSTQLLEVFFVDPDTGAVLDGTAIGANTAIQPHITHSVPIKPAVLAIGDFNGDGIPDIVVSNPYGNGTAYFYLGALDSSTGVLSYSAAQAINPPTPNSAFGTALAAADLDGDGRDELAIGNGGAKSNPNQMLLYQFNTVTATFSAYQTLNDPAPKTQGGYASSVAFADVTGTSALDLIVGAANVVYVYPGSGATFTAAPLTVTQQGQKVGGANVDGGSVNDLVAAGSNGGAVLDGPVFSGQTPAFTIGPIAGVKGIWLHDMVLGDINGDGLADIVAGAPNNAGSSSCPGGGGSVYVFLTNTATPDQPTRYMLEPPRIGTGYGESVAVSPAPYRLIFVGENVMGQVWVYKVN